MDLVAAASSVPLILPWPWKCPRGSRAVWEGGWQHRVEWAEAASWGEGSTRHPALTSASLSWVGQPTGGSVMTPVYRWHSLSPPCRERKGQGGGGWSKRNKKAALIIYFLKWEDLIEREKRWKQNGWMCFSLLPYPPRGFWSLSLDVEFLISVQEPLIF